MDPRQDIQDKGGLRVSFHNVKTIRTNAHVIAVVAALALATGALPRSVAGDAGGLVILAVLHAEEVGEVLLESFVVGFGFAVLLRWDHKVILSWAGQELNLLWTYGVALAHASSPISASATTSRGQSPSN